MISSVTALLSAKFGIAARPGRKCPCPFCGHRTLSIKADDTLAKCFYPNCGKFLATKRQGGHANGL
jgi:transcription elongation factor Elf1